MFTEDWESQSDWQSGLIWILQNATGCSKTSWQFLAQHLTFCWDQTKSFPVLLNRMVAWMLKFRACVHSHPLHPCSRSDIFPRWTATAWETDGAGDCCRGRKQTNKKHCSHIRPFPAGPGLLCADHRWSILRRLHILDWPRRTCAINPVVSSSSWYSMICQVDWLIWQKIN